MALQGERKLHLPGGGARTRRSQGARDDRDEQLPCPLTAEPYGCSSYMLRSRCRASRFLAGPVSCGPDHHSPTGRKDAVAAAEYQVPVGRDYPLDTTSTDASASRRTSRTARPERSDDTSPLPHPGGGSQVGATAWSSPEPGARGHHAVPPVASGGR